MVKTDFQNYFPMKIFVRFAKYQNAKRVIARKAKVLRCPYFALILDFLSVTVWAQKKKKIENSVSIQSYMYNFVTKFEKVCLGLIAPKFEVPKGWPSTGTCSFYIIKCMVKTDFQNYFLTKRYSSVLQNIKMRNGLIAEKTKVLRCPHFALILGVFSAVSSSCSFSTRLDEEIKGLFFVFLYNLRLVVRLPVVCLSWAGDADEFLGWHWLGQKKVSFQ